MTQSLNLLTTTFKSKSFHNILDWSGACSSAYPLIIGGDFQIYSARILENVFVKLFRPWHDLIIKTPCNKPQLKFAQKSLFAHLQGKDFPEKHLVIL